MTLRREFTQNQRHETRNAPSPAFHWHMFCATAVPWVSTTLQTRTPIRPLQTRFPAPRVKPLRVSSIKLRLAPYALLLTPPSQIPAHHHLIYRIVTLKTGKMPHKSVFCTKVQINWADCENSGQIVTLTVKLLPESCKVVVGVTLETHHLAQQTCAPGFRRLFLLLRQSPATTQPRGTRESARSKRFHSLLQGQGRIAQETLPLAKD